MAKWIKLVSIQQIAGLNWQDALYEYPLSDEPISKNEIEHALHPTTNSKSYQITDIWPDPHPSRNDPKYNTYSIKQVMPYTGNTINKSVNDLLNGFWWIELTN